MTLTDAAKIRQRTCDPVIQCSREVVVLCVVVAHLPCCAPRFKSRKHLPEKGLPGTFLLLWYVCKSPLRQVPMAVHVL
jgi:hypothetical protein